MKSNFYFLKQKQSALYESAFEAESKALTAPRVSAFYSRRALEIAVKWLFRNDRTLRVPYQDTLSAMMHEASFTRQLPSGMFQKLQVIRKLGNHAVHSDGKLRKHESLLLVKNLWSFLVWIYSTYSSNPEELRFFNEELLNKDSQVDKKAKELKKLEESFEQKDMELKVREAALIAQEEEFNKREAELKKLQEIKEQNKDKAEKQAIEYNSLTEAQTRDLLIDIMLKEAGWDPKASNVEEYEVSPFPNKSNKGFVDYVLWGDDGKPLAVVEAKKTKVDPNRGRRQAKLYADSLEVMTGQRPIIFYTSGYVTYIWDDNSYPPREVSGFYKKDELQTLINRRAIINPNIETADINEKIAGRYYQHHAIKAVCHNYSGQHRKSLLVMATGSGKTRTSIALCELLMKNNWVKRVLFLADRNALIKQAKANFNTHLPNTTTVNLVTEKEDQTSRICFSTYPTMMNLIDEASDNEKRFSPGHFDLIIVDEAHRSIYQKYKAIFQYFDSLVLGLTATPKGEVDKNTYEWFDIQDNVPHYAYELEQAIDDGFLVDFNEVNVPTKFHRDGIVYDELSDEEKAEYEENFYDEENAYLPDKIEASKLNSWVFNKDTIDKVLSCVMEKGLKIEGGDKLGKTIIFAKNQKHAEEIKKRFDILFPHLKGGFLEVVTHQLNYVETVIDDFYIPDKPPFIAVSVDMLDTGIDVPEILNLALFKVVRSKTKFWQMIGRGTRIRENLFGEGKHKEKFYVFDFCENFKFFGEKPNGVEAKTQKSLSQKIFEKRLSIAGLLRSNERKLDPSSYLDDLTESVKKLNIHNFINRPHSQIIEKYQIRNNWNDLSEGEISDILNDLSKLIISEDGNEAMRRFDLLMYSLQEGLLVESPYFDFQRKKLINISTGLSKKKNVPAVEKHMEAISKVQSETFWKNINIEQLEATRLALRGLVQFLDHEDGQSNVFVNFEDHIDDVVIDSGDSLKPDLKLEAYKEKIQVFFRENEDNLSIYKLRNNLAITASDVQSLETILFENSTEAKSKFIQKYGVNRPLGLFIREAIGMEREAVIKAFSKITSDSFNAAQIQFLNEIIEYIVRRGHLDIGDLYEPPFTNINTNSLDGVFSNELSEQLVRIINQINSQVEVVA